MGRRQIREERPTRRRFFSTAFGAAALASYPQRTWPLSSAVSNPKYNVLFLAVDDLRPQLGCYGDRFAITSNMDALAEKGTVFNRAYCQQAFCGPSRASLLTGLRPDTIRVYDLNTSFRDAVPDAVTLPQHFKQNGYHTENVGKIFHGNDVMNDRRSWSVPERLHQVVKRDQYALEKNQDPDDEWKKMSATESADAPDEAYIDGRVAADAVRTLGRLKGKRFFLGVGFTKPHLPFAAPKKYWDLFDPRELPISADRQPARGAPPPAVPDYSELRSYPDIPDSGPLSEETKRRVVHGYYAATAYADAMVGKVLDELDRLDLARRTVVVLWGDHGWHLGEQSHWGKLTNFEVCVRAPLIVRAPNQEQKGGHAAGLVEFLDIYPTLADVCGLPIPDRLEGKSFARLLDEPSLLGKPAAFSQHPRNDSSGRSMGYSMRTDRYRYNEWIRPSGELAGTELYDHRADPNEMKNIAAEPANQDLVARLSAQLKNSLSLPVRERPL